MAGWIQWSALPVALMVLGVIVGFAVIGALIDGHQDRKAVNDRRRASPSSPPHNRRSGRP